MSPSPLRSGRFSFLAKPIAALLLVALADMLFTLKVPPGAVAGVFAGAWVVMVATTRRAAWRDPGSMAALAMGLAYAVALFDDPSLIALTMLWVAVSLAAMLPRRRFGNALGWIVPLIVHAATGPFRPLMDAWHIARIKRRPGRVHLRGIAAMLALPLIGGILFIALFAAANPLISGAFDRLMLPAPGQILFWIVVLLCVWPALRPWAGTLRAALPSAGATTPAAKPMTLPAVPLASVLIALATFNLIFAVQNGLDIVFLWSGAPLPGSTTLADYAHRGAYALIATALIAGGLALWMLRPGSAIAADRRARVLLILWVGQNLMLVASSMLRTIDYVDAYSLTRLRIAALAWMVLVGIGLILICWRILANRSATWLVNRNIAATAALLTAACFVDLGAVAAHWNVRHAREAGGSGPAIDLCYLDRLGASALVPLITLEPQMRDPELRERVTWLRNRELRNLAHWQRDWHSWTWRGARRLDVAHTMVGQPPAADRNDSWRDCGGAKPDTASYPDQRSAAPAATPSPMPPAAPSAAPPTALPATPAAPAAPPSGAAAGKSPLTRAPAR